MRVLTIYNHGTASSSLDPASGGEIINIFGNNAMASADNNFIITEGAGSKGSPHNKFYFRASSKDSIESINRNPTYASERDLRHYVAGDLIMQAAGNASTRLVGADLTKKISSIVGPLLRKAGESLGGPLLKGLGIVNERTMAQVIGLGVDENIIKVLETIAVLSLRKETTPDRINMIGWSRGAVTCIRIAYFLNLDARLSKIPVYIFAVDPVPGQGLGNDIDAKTIGKNVQHYVATLAVHENRQSFSPIECNFTSATTQRVTLPLPGDHSNTAKYNNDKHNNSSGAITFHLCAKFLQNHNTVLSKNIISKYIISDEDLYEKYKNISKDKNINWTGQGWKKLLTQSLSLHGHPRDALLDYGKQAYINLHHLAIAQKIGDKDAMRFAATKGLEAVRACGLMTDHSLMGFPV